MNRPLKLALRFSYEELSKLETEPSTDQVKKLVWFYGKAPEYVMKAAPFKKEKMMRVDKGKTYYVQLSNLEEKKILEPFSGNRSYFVKHLLLNEKKIFESLFDTITDKLEIRLKLDHLEELILQKQNPSLNQKEEIVTEDIRSFPDSVDEIKENKLRMPPTGAGKYY